MADHRSMDARALALESLRLSRRGGVFVHDALDRLMRDPGVPSVEAAFATELALGISRHRLTLHHLLSQLVRGRWKNYRPDLQDVLCLGAYQLLFLQGVPDHAAVDCAVESAKGIGGRRAAGLTNAVLRELLRQRRDRGEGPADVPATHRIEIGENRYVTLDRAVLPDPDADPATWLSLATSHPLWLVRRWMKAHGFERTTRICGYGARRPELFLRPNRLRITPAGLLARLRSENADVALDEDRGLVHWRSGPAMTGLTAFKEGLFQPQDPTAKAVVDHVRPRCGQVVLDLCAAPGTKATHAAEWMQDQGVIVAADRTADRLALIEENARRLGISIIRTCPAAEVGSRLHNQPPPDVILVDAPCSNTGVLARRPEARYRLRPDGLKKLARQQQELLDQAAGLAGRETRIMYSTCSIEPEENESVISAFCYRHGRFRLQHSRLVLPDAGTEPVQWHDGGFLAELVPAPLSR